MTDAEHGDRPRSSGAVGRQYHEEVVERLKGNVNAVQDENKRLRALITKHHSERGHERCWESDAELYRGIGLDPGEPEMPPIEEHRRRCDEWRAAKYGCLPSSEPVAVVQDLAMMVRVLLSKKKPVSDEMRERYSDFLRRHNLQGSILRSEPDPKPAIFWAFSKKSAGNSRDGWIVEHDQSYPIVSHHPDGGCTVEGKGGVRYRFLRGEWEPLPGLLERKKGGPISHLQCPWPECKHIWSVAESFTSRDYESCPRCHQSFTINRPIELNRGGT